MKLPELLKILDMAGVRHGNRDALVAEKTGYAKGTVTRILSGNAAVTDRFSTAVVNAFTSTHEQAQNSVKLNGTYTKDDLIRILHSML